MNSKFLTYKTSKDEIEENLGLESPSFDYVEILSTEQSKRPVASELKELLPCSFCLPV